LQVEERAKQKNVRGGKERELSETRSPGNTPVTGPKKTSESKIEKKQDRSRRRTECI